MVTVYGLCLSLKLIIQVLIFIFLQYFHSQVYFYEYNEHSKPVDKPRQCLPYAVIHVKSVNQKGGADSFLTSLKCKLKRLPKHTGKLS